MLIATLLLVGTVLVLMALAEDTVRRWPLSPALIYLAVGWAAAWLASPPLPTVHVQQHAPLLRVMAELAVLVSLFAIGLKVRIAGTWAAWRAPVLLATISVVWVVLLATLLAWWLLALAWPMALLLATILAPTDPVLASDVQTRDEQDRDGLRMALTVEGALNDGTAFPLVMLALGLAGLGELGTYGLRWVGVDLLWSIGTGAALGLACGRGIGWVLLKGLRANTTQRWDELLYLGTIALVYGLSLALHVSSFLAVFVCGATLLRQHPATHTEPQAQERGQHLQDFGARCERMAEVLMVLVMGAALAHVRWSWAVLGFALLMVLVVRPASVWLGVPPHVLPSTQRRLVAWFGVRGVGSLFYLAYVLEHGLQGDEALVVASACLVCVAVSVALHGASATPLMAWYQKRRTSRKPA
jgi:sodium/hydrogen antiporter